MRLDRLLRLPEAEVRREGAALDRQVFDAVVAAAREHHALSDASSAGTRLAESGRS